MQKEQYFKEKENMKTAKRIVLSLTGLICLLVALSYLFATSGEKPLTNEIRAGLPGKMAKLTHGSIYYRWHGLEQGPVIVFVHGFSTPQFVFDKNVPVLVKEGYRVLTFDHFGRGYSDRPEGPYDENFFDQEMTELFTALKITKPVIVFGYSLGGGISAVFAARHPELIRKLVLAAPVGFMKKPSGKNALLMVPVLGEYLFAVVGKNSLINGFEKEEKQGYATKDMVRLFTQQFEYKGAWQAMLATMRNYPMHALKSYYEMLGKQKMPVLILWGTADKSVSFNGSGPAKRAVPRAELKVFEGLPHSLVYSHSDKINKEVLSFLKK